MNRPIKFRAWNDFGSGQGEMVTEESHGLTSAQILSRFSTVMQFTGLTDRAGTEIYEGDVLSDRWKVEVFVAQNGAYRVKFHTGPGVNKPIDLDEYLKRREAAGTGERDCVVIGNIHTHPELIESAKP